MLTVREVLFFEPPHDPRGRTFGNAGVASQNLKLEVDIPTRTVVMTALVAGTPDPTRAQVCVPFENVKSWRGVDPASVESPAKVESLEKKKAG